jgi:hypothetical protein
MPLHEGAIPIFHAAAVIATLQNLEYSVTGTFASAVFLLPLGIVLLRLLSDPSKHEHLAILT